MGTIEQTGPLGVTDIIQVTDVLAWTRVGAVPMTRTWDSGCGLKIKAERDL